MKDNKVAVRIFLEEDDHRFIMDNKDDSGVSLQEFVGTAVKSAIAHMKKDLFIVKTKEK